MEDSVNREMETTITTSVKGPDTKETLFKPLSSEQMTSELSNRLVFGNAEGGNIAAKKGKRKRKHKATHSGETEESSRKHRHPFLTSDNSVQSSDTDIEPVVKYAKVDNDTGTDKDDTLVATESEIPDYEAISEPGSLENADSPWTGPSNTADTGRDLQSPTDEFNIVDDIEGDDNDDDAADDDSNDGLDDDEIYGWLEEGIEKKETKTSAATDGNIEFETIEKIVMVEKGRNHFEVLPENWVVVDHNSGMPIYFHKPTRVCTLSKPYFIGTGVVRKHNVPVTSIPCLHYRREKQKERDMEDNSGKNPATGADSVNEPAITNGEPASNTVPTSNGSGEPAVSSTDLTLPATSARSVRKEQSIEYRGTMDKLPAPKLTSFETVEKESAITANELHGYCDQLFEFRQFTVRRFNNWKEKRKHYKHEKRAAARPGLPGNTRLITCPIKQINNSTLNTKSLKKKEFVFNPNGKTPLCVLHEYAQHVLKVQPTYSFTETENAENPYSATVMINDIAYCTGHASSKKLAKAQAAKMTLEVLIPSLPGTMEWDKDQSKVAWEKKQEKNSDHSFFDNITVDDPRVTDLCNTAALMRPYQVLQVCLKRNFGMGDTSINIERNVLPNQKTEYTMTVGKHKVMVVSKNKKDGKQRAAQAMLKALHTHINNWGSMLRLYGKTTVLGFNERDDEPVTETQYQQSEKNQMNTMVIEKLKEAMRKVKSMRQHVVSRGTMKLPTASLQRNVRPIDL